jgi:hypothetical protein
MFFAGQLARIAGDLAAAELQLQTAVKTDPRIIVLRVTHWFPLSTWQIDGPNPCCSKAWRNSCAKVQEVKWEMRVE